MEDQHPHIHYETRVTGFSPDRKTVSVEGENEVGYDKLIVAAGFDYADPGGPDTDLGNLYYVKNICRASRESVTNLARPAGGR